MCLNDGLQCCFYLTPAGIIAIGVDIQMEVPLNIYVAGLVSCSRQFCKAMIATTAFIDVDMSIDGSVTLLSFVMLDRYTFANESVKMAILWTKPVF